jgi:hypothetical protein
LEHTGHHAVDELAAVIGVKAEDAEGKLPQHGLQHRLQPRLTDARAGGNDLPLRDLINGITVKNALSSGRIALMYGVDTQIPGLALRIGPPPFSNGDGGGPGLDVVQTSFAIARLLAQVVEVRHREGG